MSGSDVYCHHWGGYCDACEMTMGCGRRCGDRRGQGSQCFNYSGSLLVPRNGPLPVILEHPHPLSLHVLCKCQIENLCPKRRRAESYWWSTISGPNLPTPRFFYGNPTRVNSQQCCETRASSFFYEAKKQLCPDMLSPWAKKAAKNIN